MIKLKLILEASNVKAKLNSLDYTKFKQALLNRKKNPEDEDAHDAVVKSMYSLLKKAGGKDVDIEDIRQWMEDEVFMGQEGVSAAISTFKELATDFIDGDSDSGNSTYTEFWVRGKLKTNSIFLVSKVGPESVIHIFRSGGSYMVTVDTNKSLSELESIMKKAGLINQKSKDDWNEFDWTGDSQFLLQPNSAQKQADLIRYLSKKLKPHGVVLTLEKD